ncbi:hypothetical protein B0H14DRAFT_2603946 [Mycena olivaceomarginata]|nr:hypothetical protein B0H14DRAFT_2603946 [Mycena olivaceomarginata]
MRGEYASEGANSLPHAQRTPRAPRRHPYRARAQPAPAQKLFHNSAHALPAANWVTGHFEGEETSCSEYLSGCTHRRSPRRESRPSRARPPSPPPHSNAGVWRYEVARSRGGQVLWGGMRWRGAMGGSPGGECTRRRRVRRPPRAAHHAPPAAGMPPSRPPPPAPPPCSDVGVGRHGGVRSGVGEVSVRDARAARHAPPATEIPHSPLHRPHRRPALQRELGGMRGARSDDGRAPALRRPSSNLAAAYCRTHRAHADGATPPPSHKH